MPERHVRAWEPNTDALSGFALDAQVRQNRLANRLYRAPYARLVWTLQRVAGLRRYVECKTASAGLMDVRTLNGILAAASLDAKSADAAALASGSFGWEPNKELEELERATRPGGTILMSAFTGFDKRHYLRHRVPVAASHSILRC